MGRCVVECETYTTKQVAKATGLSLRQLQWWDEKGYMPCRQVIGHKRRWDRSALRLLLIVKALRGKGIAASRAAEIANLIPSHARWVVVWSQGFEAFADKDCAVSFLMRLTAPAVLVAL